MQRNDLDRIGTYATVVLRSWYLPTLGYQLGSLHSQIDWAR